MISVDGTFYCELCQIYAVALNYGKDSVWCYCGELMIEVKE